MYDSVCLEGNVPFVIILAAITQPSFVSGWVIQRMEEWRNLCHQLLALLLCIPAIEGSDLLDRQQECVSQMVVTLAKLQLVKVFVGGYCVTSTYHCRNIHLRIPSCLAILCGSLDAPENGNVVQANPPVVGSVATYTCNSGFILIGSSVRVCQVDGTYSDNQPTCISMDYLKCLI